MTRWKTVLLPVAVAVAVAGCSDGTMLRAARVERQDELIGGPTARGKLGDYLIENDRIRAVVGGPGPGWAAGVFGGTLLDVDLRRWQSERQGGHGFDAFAEAFPLANLIVANPADPTKSLKLGEEMKLVDGGSAVTILKDGSDGQEAIIRVEGHAAYMFDVIKFLNRGFLEGLKVSTDSLSGLLGSYAETVNNLLGGKPLDLAGIQAFLPMVGTFMPELKPLLDGLNVFALLNRLQISFDFTTDYILHPGEQFLTMRTTVRLSPPSEELLGGCGPVVCDKECPDGYAMQEVDEPSKWETPTGGSFDYTYKRMCPVCECAGKVDAMPTFNESRDIFKLLLGEPAKWKDPAWKGSVIAGDFLFYGANASAFGQGFGFDIDRKIYEQMWQGVGTLGSPFVLDWLAATAKNVSYAWTTTNPRERSGFDCPSYRIAVARVDEAREADLVQALVDGWGLAPADAKARARQLVVDRKPIVLVEGIPVPPAGQRGEFANWEAGLLAPGGPAKPILDGLAGIVTEKDLVVLPQHDCMPSKLLVPLYSTSATAVLTHFSEGDAYLEVDAAGGKRWQDATRAYTFTRYLAVGEGDVASAVRVVYDIRKTPHGEVEGVVFEAGSMTPIPEVDVFALLDPRPDDSAPVPASFREYRRLAMAAFGHPGVMSQMMTNVGLGVDVDGRFSGALPPGRYLLVAHTTERGSSPLVPVVVTEGRTAVAHLALPAAGRVEYRVEDQGGAGSPARLTFVSVDPTGRAYDWDAMNEPELGDPRYDHGIVHHEFTLTGRGTAEVAPGTYDIYASRGIEFGVAVARGFEVRPGARQPLHLVLRREMDTTGWVSGDFHVHMGNSVDSGLSAEKRIKAAVAEGLEVFASSDHDFVTSYLPTILALDVQRFLKVIIGAEVSPLEYGHFNGFPLHYDDTVWPNHDPPPWPGRLLVDAWRALRERADAPEDAFILQVNHPRDGVMGYFGQLGVKGYSLERKTPGMEMCAEALEVAPCDFDSFEILNGKNFQYLHTPTVVEEADYIRCYREIVAATDRARFALAANGDAAVCATLQRGPDPSDADCSKAVAAAAGVDRTAPVDDAAAGLVIAADHCRWHAAFRAELERCAGPGVTLLDCKRLALEALKYLSVRYMVERTPSENDRYFETTAETDIGCSLEDACKDCVCASMPECCKKAGEDGGTGWTASCEARCRADCPASLDRPCTDRFEPVEDYFAFLDAGFDKTVVGNSDSHGIQKEIGLPRNFVRSGTDSPQALEPLDLNRAIKARKVVVSSGPFIDFELSAGGPAAGAGEVLDASGGGSVSARLVVQTPSWFKVDRVEIYRNSRLERRIFPDRPREELVDLDTVIDLGRPAEDSWYVVAAYGLNDAEQLSPVYKREAFGNILISTLISLGAQQILSSFGSVLDALGGADAIGTMLGGVELPDSFPNLPFAIANAVKVDVDGGGWRPPKARVLADGSFDLPPFCSRPCSLDPAAPSPCGRDQVCMATPATPLGGTCGIPIPDGCVGLQRVAE